MWNVFSISQNFGHILVFFTAYTNRIDAKNWFFLKILISFDNNIFQFTWASQVGVVNGLHLQTYVHTFGGDT
jgi:hypothetical protein